MDKDAYPTTMPQALKLLEKFKSDSGTVTKGNDSDDETGVAFAQTENWDANVTCHKCGVKGHRVNDCPDMTAAQIKKLWADRNTEYLEKQEVPEVKKGVANNDMAKDKPALSVPVAADMAKFEQFECFVPAAKELGIDLLNMETPVNEGINILSDAVSTPSKQVTFAEVVKETGKRDDKRFTLDSWNLYLDSCATYHSEFLRSLLHNVREVKMMLQGN